MPEEITINEDELVGFIRRKVSCEENLNLTYEEVHAVLKYEEAFLESKGLVDTTER